MNIKIWSTNNKLPSYISYFINSIEEQSWVKDFFQCKSAKVGTGTWIEIKKKYIFKMDQIHGLIPEGQAHQDT